MKIAIIEDEPLAAQRLRGLLADYPEADVEIVGETDSVAEAIDEIGTWGADLLLCDIRLADGLSFNIWERVEVDTPTIFTTAYEEYALRAFKVNSVDYLLKPIQAEELYAALSRFANANLRSRKTRRDAPDTPAGPGPGASPAPSAITAELLAQVRAAMQAPVYRERLMAKAGDKLLPIDVAEVCFFESVARITWAYRADGSRHAVGETLAELEGLLDPRRFRRLNRALIASAGAVEQLVPYSNSRYRAHLRGHKGEPVIVARERVQDIKTWLGGG